MIAFLKGIIEAKLDHSCLLDVNGVGYEVQMPTSDLQRLPEPGAAVTLHTWHVQREDAQQLFGFTAATDRKLFKLLLGIANVGPKLALAVLSGLTQEQLEDAVARQDAERLTRLPGIGRKTAERMLLELKDKLDKSDVPPAIVRLEAEGAWLDALEALQTLGYSGTQARLALQKVVDQELPAKVPGQDRVAEFVRRALKHL